MNAPRVGITTSLRPVSDEDTARRIEERRARYGIPVSRLADMAPVDRGRLSKYLDPEKPGHAKEVVSASKTWVGRIESALARFEEEIGVNAPALEAAEEDLVEFRVSGNFGVDVVVKGPIRDMAQLEESVARLVARMQAKPGSDA